jgi:glycosyltransferase involved in cell wall biosynthesis
MPENPVMSMPKIEPIRGESGRPLWSVMIPTYEPGNHLQEGLRSVLRQDPGRATMQIEVVDDGSATDVATLVANIGEGRVAFRKNERREGLFGNWNACIRATAGEYVHILHQDDLVVEGFYEKMGLLLDANPEAGAAFCRHTYIDEESLSLFFSAIEQRNEGVLTHWRKRFAEGISIQCPAMVVRRTTYEKVGLFNTDFGYMGDLEMWLRIASRMPVCYTPWPLACWRMHAKSASAKCIAQGHEMRDGLRIANLMSSYFPECVRERTVFKAKALAGIRGTITRLVRSGDIGAAAERTRLLWALDGRSWRTRKLIVQLLCMIFLAALRRTLRGSTEVL